jgi:hypothetical protein
MRLRLPGTGWPMSATHNAGDPRQRPLGRRIERPKTRPIPRRQPSIRSVDRGYVSRQRTAVFIVQR